MVGLALAALTVTVAGQVLLVAAALHRLRSGPSLASVLRAHSVVPPWARTNAVARGMEAAQLTVGVSGLAGIMSGHAGTAGLAALCSATAAMFTGFAGYLVTVLRRRGRVPCGCLGGHERVRSASITRAVVFAAAPLAALPFVGMLAGELGGWPVRIAVAAGAGVVAAFAVLLVGLADALAYD